MKKNSISIKARVTLGTLFFLTGIFLVVLALSTTGLRSATPSSGILNPTGREHLRGGRKL
jgi:Na+/H+ antiporter NhaD/arsenite permease-like protein